MFVYTDPDQERKNIAWMVIHSLHGKNYIVCLFSVIFYSINLKKKSNLNAKYLEVLSNVFSTFLQISVDY